jgi:predicted NUDIX family NTP pyrophosphohydrolase
MPKRSAGLLMYRRRDDHVEVLLAHPGGPFWAKKDLGAWSIPKGELDSDEDLLLAAKREFEEETGLVPEGTFIALDELKQPGGKIVTAWAFEGYCDASQLKSNTFSMEWPPRSGRMAEFSEVDRWEWFSLDEAGKRILVGQKVFLERLLAVV